MLTQYTFIKEISGGRQQLWMVNGNYYLVSRARPSALLILKQCYPKPYETMVFISDEEGNHSGKEAYCHRGGRDFADFTTIVREFADTLTQSSCA